MPRIFCQTFLVLVTGMFGLSSAASAQNFRLDSAHTFIAFEVRHADLTNAWGLASGPTGTFTLDQADPTKSSFEVQVRAESIITGNSQRDTHLRGPDFFDARQFPTISFKSTSVKMNGADYEVTGDFTLHGVTKPLTVTIRKTGQREASGNRPAAIGLSTKFTVKRSEFGMTGMQNAVGDEVTLHVNIEGIQR